MEYQSIIIINHHQFKGFVWNQIKIKVNEIHGPRRASCRRELHTCQRSSGANGTGSLGLWGVVAPRVGPAGDSLAMAAGRPQNEG